MPKVNNVLMMMITLAQCAIAPPCFSSSFTNQSPWKDQLRSWAHHLIVSSLLWKEDSHPDNLGNPQLFPSLLSSETTAASSFHMNDTSSAVHLFTVFLPLVVHVMLIFIYLITAKGRNFRKSRVLDNISQNQSQWLHWWWNSTPRNILFMGTIIFVGSLLSPYRRHRD